MVENILNEDAARKRYSYHFNVHILSLTWRFSVALILFFLTYGSSGEESTKSVDDTDSSRNSKCMKTRNTSYFKIYFFNFCFSSFLHPSSTVSGNVRDMWCSLIFIFNFVNTFNLLFRMMCAQELHTMELVTLRKFWYLNTVNPSIEPALWNNNPPSNTTLTI